MKKTELTEIEQTVASNLKILRRVRGYTLKQLADVLEVTGQQVQKYESGSSRIPIDKLVILAKCLNVNLEFFVKRFEI